MSTVTGYSGEIFYCDHCKGVYADGICPLCGALSQMRTNNSEFDKLLEQAKEIHARKAHDYTKSDDPYGNYHFAGLLSKLFSNPDDAGFVGRIGEKLYRLSALEDRNPVNESVEDTEIDLVTIMTLWMASRRDRRKNVR